MSLLPFTKILTTQICHSKSFKSSTFFRNLMSKQLMYAQFGDPLCVVKFKECPVPCLQGQDVLVRMLAAPVNPADINTIQGKKPYLPCLPSIPGDEGVGEIMETGALVGQLKKGDRVVITSRLLGTWRYYGIYHERDLHIVSDRVPLPEAATLTMAPCTAYRMLKDFKQLLPGQAVIQNAANSPTGQAVIQLCKAWGIKTYNIVANHCAYETVKAHLLSIGATAVHTLEEAEQLCCFNTSLERPVLALNCLGGKYEDIMLKLLDCNGTIVYYDAAYTLPLAKQFLRGDATFYKFDLADWQTCACSVDKDIMLSDIVQLMVLGQFRAPMYEPVELKDFVYAFRNTVHCEAFSVLSYIFDFSLP